MVQVGPPSTVLTHQLTKNERRSTTASYSNCLYTRFVQLSPSNQLTVIIFYHQALLVSHVMVVTPYYFYLHLHLNIPQLISMDRGSQEDIKEDTWTINCN